MATSGARPPRRVPVSFDADVWAQEVERLRSRTSMRAAAQRAREEIAARGVSRSALRACSAEGDDGTRLARCLKVYVPLGDRPASERPYAFVFELAVSGRGWPDAAAHRLRGAPPGARDAHGLRARSQALARPLPRPVAPPAARTLTASRATARARTAARAVGDVHRNTHAVAMGEAGQQVKVRHCDRSRLRPADAREALAIVHNASAGEVRRQPTPRPRTGGHRLLPPLPSDMFFARAITRGAGNR